MLTVKIDILILQSNGQFYKPSCVSTDQYNLELEFFGLAALYREYVASLEIEPKSKPNATYENPTTLVQKLWNFFKDPKYSQAARVWAIIDVSIFSETFNRC